MKISAVFLIALTLLSTHHRAWANLSVGPRSLRFFLEQDKKLKSDQGPCAQALDDFLNTMQELFPEMGVSIINEHDSNDYYQLQCIEQALGHADLLITDMSNPNQQRLKLRWHQGYEGLNAEDLLIFQKHIESRSSLSILNPTQSIQPGNEAFLLGALDKNPNPDMSYQEPLYKKWWFWGLLATASSAAGFAIYKSSQPSGAKIHFR
jgi:hypothetical protein